MSKGSSIVKHAGERSALSLNSPWWELFQPPVEDLSNEQFEYIEIYEDGGDLNPSANNLRFTSKDNGGWIVPSESYLEISGYFAKTNGATALAAGDTAVFAGDICALFQQMRYSINDHPVERVDYCQDASVIMDVANCNDNKQATSMGFRVMDGEGLVAAGIEQSAQVISFTDNAITAANLLLETFNEGLAKLRRDTQLSRGFYYRIPLKHLFKIHEYCPRAYIGQRHQIQLQKQTNANIYAFAGSSAGAEITATFVQSSIRWWLPTAKPTPEVSLVLESALSSGQELRCAWEAINVFQRTFTETNPVWRIANLNTQPTWVFIGVKPARANAVQSWNSGEYSNGSPGTLSGALGTVAASYIDNVQLRFNGRQFPMQIISTSAEKDIEATAPSIRRNYLRAYNDFLAYGRKNSNCMESSAIDYREYYQHYPLFVFDLSKADPALLTGANAADLELRMTFSTTPFVASVGSSGAELTALVLSERELVMRGTALDRIAVIGTKGI